MRPAKITHPILAGWHVTPQPVKPEVGVVTGRRAFRRSSIYRTLGAIPGPREKKPPVWIRAR
ncbi:hypothetical protein GCM10023223_17500 [Stackebrandtia albiflava]